MHRIITKLVILSLLVSFFSVSTLTPAARAAVIGTTAILSTQTNSTQAEIQTFLAREDVRDQMIILGVDPADARIRIAALTDQEINQLQLHINDLPAGANALAVLGAVFLVLIVLELLGVTNVFSKL